MTTPDPDAPRPRTRTFRQGSAIGSGALLLVVAALFLLSALRDENRTGWAAVLWPLAVMLVTWAVLIRPCVRLVETGVELRNVVRDAVLTWPAIDLVESRWALTLVTEEGKAFKSFAITAQRPKRDTSQTGTDGRARVLDHLKHADPDKLAHRPGSAGGVARDIRAITEQYEVGTRKGYVEPLEARAQVRPAYLGIAAVATALVCVVVALLG